MIKPNKFTFDAVEYWVELTPDVINGDIVRRVSDDAEVCRITMDPAFEYYHCESPDGLFVRIHSNQPNAYVNAIKSCISGSA